MRKTLTYVVQDEGRDTGKHFLLTEMPASQAERWAIRAFLAMAKGGIELPDGIEQSGMAGIAKVGLGLLLKIPPEDALPLLDEMMGCVQFIPNPSNKAVFRALIEDDIEDVMTRFKIRKEVFGLHVDFSLAGAKSTSESAPAAEKAASSTIEIRRRPSRQ
jgi:hypothetical protein